ncbi:hypothetical protein ABOM_011877 [Aspergillus bombycis]|uniref:Uncharacterized protein n=1 Tax=Aspergillus bombycis TaxID=109264 RepID=A0A1F7ZJY3_9EURO|nr:hypothetical protein ABOM_011877 [Aspergillus bombycis]OGM39751.1 hypothetical protein ABOM_011877 [Aspergillus bombycis]
MKLSVTVVSLFLVASMAMPAPTQPNQIQRRIEANNLGDLLNKDGLAGVAKTLQESVHVGSVEKGTTEGPSTAGQ